MARRGNAHLQSGKQAEQIAHDYLKAKGLRLIQANYRCRVGELDLVMLDGLVLVIVEVRYRKTSRIAGPMQTIDSRKRHRLALAARHFLMRHDHLQERPVRFDVIGLTGSMDKPSISWAKNALEFDVV